MAEKEPKDPKAPKTWSPQFEHRYVPEEGVTKASSALGLGDLGDLDDLGDCERSDAGFEGGAAAGGAAAEEAAAEDAAAPSGGAASQGERFPETTLQYGVQLLFPNNQSGPS